jgi:FkbM family methyltransferase
MADPGLSFGRVLALEPDPVNFSRLDAFVRSLPDEKKGRIELIQAAVADVPGEIRFRSTGTGASSFDPGGDVVVRAVPLDRIVSGGGKIFLKFDVEGAEGVALRGAANLIESSSPFLAVSVYHRQEHLWELPGLIARLQERYRQKLRPHNADGFDLVCYAFVDEAGEVR